MSDMKKQPMAKSTIQAASEQSVLDKEVISAIAADVLPTTPAPEVSARIKDRLLSRVKSQDYFFQFKNEDQWKQISAGIEIRLLHKTDDARSFLVRMAANTSLDEHAHSHNEESYVIEGEVWLQGILCHAGDYHYAKAGSRHEKIHTDKGCTLLVKCS
jgi:quercetin dioxygenase-like cupin family protein